MLTSITQVIRRELLIAFRRQADVFNPLWFSLLLLLFSH